MSYALVISNVVQSEGGLPDTARRLDNGAWVSGLRTYATVAQQQACGYYLVVDVIKPADTAQHTHDRSITLPGGVPTVTWTQRLKTQPELDNDTAIANEAAIGTYLADALVPVTGLFDVIINRAPVAFTQQGVRDVQRDLQDAVRALRRVTRKVQRTLDGST